MTGEFRLVPPAFLPPLDPGYRPAVLAHRAFQQEVDRSGSGTPLVFGLERPGGAVSRYETRVFASDHPRAGTNVHYAERTLKFLLWQRGAWRVHVGGPRSIGQSLKRTYAPGGERALDADMLGRQVYQKPFSLLPCAPEEVPGGQEEERPLGRHLDGCRIGFDLGASDLKVSAVVGGQAVYTQEIIWQPSEQTDPGYHYDILMAALRTAAAQMPRLDAIGGSSAGILVDGQPRVASLFRAIPEEHYGEVTNLFERIRDAMGVPLEVLNDGHVAALAGSMSLEDNPVLGIAMGSSQAGGYVSPSGYLPNWLDELAFCPVDYQPQAPREDWLGDQGCGGQYFSQQCVFRLAPRAGISIPAGATNAAKLEYAQRKLEMGHDGATQIWQTMGIYLGYALAHYANFYQLKHALILGRCTSGRGGSLILEGARQVLRAEFPLLAGSIHLHLPDEHSRRVGQAIAAASLPKITPPGDPPTI